MTIHDLNVLNALLRQDLASFIAKAFATVAPGTPFQRNWHVEAVAHALQDCHAGRIKRLLITMPPRSLKSLSCTVAYPAWALGRDPARRIICVSYGQDLALEFARQSRAVMKSAWYRAAFPGVVLAKDTEAEQVTRRGGSRFATSVGGSLTGRGAGLIIIDDPLKPEDALSRSERARVIEWYRSTLYSRLDNKRDDVIILVMQRLHLDDLAGYVLEHEDWAHLNLPAIADRNESIPLGPARCHTRRTGDLLIPQREPIGVLEDLRVKLGDYHFSAQYLQQPIPEDGALIKWGWFRVYDGLPPRQPHDRIIQSWDTAAKAGELNDYSVCLTALVQGRDQYLLHILREKLDYPSLKRRVIAHARAWQADSVLIEDTVTGMALIQDVRAERIVDMPRPIGVRPEGDKVMRMAAQSAKIEAGHVLIPHQAPWLDAFKAEAAAFPNGRHDDQIDALSQLLGWIHRRRKTAGVW